LASGKSDQGEFVVIRHRPGHRVRRFLILLTFSVGAAILGYMVGMAKGGFRFSDMAKTSNVISGELTELRELERDTRQKLINLERGRRMDQQALTRARDTISGLESQVSSLRADLTFYKNIMSPTKSYKGLQVQRLELERLRDERHFSFKLVLIQVGDNKSYIDGYVTVNVVGEQDGERKVIPLKDLSEDIEDNDIRFRYRYFQDVEGVMTLPQGFELIAVQAVAKAEGKKAARVEQTFEWK
jgi:hypothetical protein